MHLRSYVFHPRPPRREILFAASGRVHQPTRTLVPHRRPVEWTGTLDRADVTPPALLQNPRTMFPVPVAGEHALG
ncbi:hypothetical protein GDN83_07000 [Gordonia jinghuaiqii]|nr:hypothetical protein [Gordonia jinghuaiqii]